jgi:hypothetical protein
MCARGGPLDEKGELDVVIDPIDVDIIGEQNDDAYLALAFRAGQEEGVEPILTAR